MRTFLQWSFGLSIAFLVLVVPVVRVANDLLRRALDDHAQRALLIVNVDTSREKARVTGSSNSSNTAIPLSDM